jgi:predicted  nucleic acid-binding Zn-ribbon protein
MKQVQPGRRGRRPSEGGLPRLPTQREQQSENEALKTKMFNMSLQLELLKKQNNELKDQLEEANRRIDDLEPLEDQNIELREDNDRLTLKVHNMEEELVNLDDQHRELLSIQSETVNSMEKQHEALDEAAEVIINLEEGKVTFQEEIERLKEQLAQSSNDSEQCHGACALDGHREKHPSRVYSIDESRPSTSHFDSDYYSQPASPQVRGKASKELARPSKELLSYSERAKNFIEQNVASKKSVQDLKKRFSDASMKQVERMKSPPPEVPEIPEIYHESYNKNAVAKALARESRRHNAKPPTLQQQLTPLSTRRPSTARASVTPRTPTTPAPKDGLRELYREIKSVDRPSQVRPSSSHRSPTSSRPSRFSEAESPFINPPQRRSSQYFSQQSYDQPATSSSEKLKASSSEGLRTDTAPTEYQPSIPPPPSVETEDLMSLPDTERWWKQVQAVHRPAAPANIALAALADGTTSRRSRYPTGAPNLNLFNPAEDEDAFMNRAKCYMPKRK